MDEKTIRVMKRLHGVIPEHLRGGWHFDAANISTFGGGEYGIISGSPRCCLGISIDVRSGLRTNYYDYDGKGGDNKTGAALAAWVAAANPENVKELLDEIERLRGVIEHAREALEYDTAKDMTATDWYELSELAYHILTEAVREKVRA